MREMFPNLMGELAARMFRAYAHSVERRMQRAQANKEKLEARLRELQ